MRFHVPMVGRDTTAEHRPSTPLELFFDLTFVVAISQAAAALHHGLVEGQGSSILAFALSFFAIWWAWMNFTWFASAYDTQDALYRLMVFVQMAGVLVLAAGIPRAFDDENFVVVTVGYLIMRSALVAQWVRAAISDPSGRTCAVRYAIGISVVQLGWVLRLLLPHDAGLLGFFVLVVGELAVPVWAEAAGRTSWHPRHMAERYGLFTIIVLGESILAATVGVQQAIDATSTLGDVVEMVIGGLLIVFSMWWVYFDLPSEQVVESLRENFDVGSPGAFVWGYGHYFVFGAIAATGAGLSVAVDQATTRTALGDVAAAATTTVPVAVYLIAVWLTHRRCMGSDAGHRLLPVAAVAILATTFLPESVLLTGAMMVALVVGSSLLSSVASSDGLSDPFTTGGAG